MNLDALRERVRSLSLRTRIAILAAGSVAVGVCLVAGGAYFVARHELIRGVDSALDQRAFFVQHVVAEQDGIGVFPPRFRDGGLGLVTQVVDSSGNVVQSLAPGSDVIPVTDRDRATAASAAPTDGSRGDVRIRGMHVRTRTLPIGGGQAVMVATQIDYIDHTLYRYALILFLLSILGIVGAALVGQLVARSAMRPVDRLTRALEHVGRTQEFDASIDIDRADELGRLGASFNAMLAALAESREQQQRLVHDANHELRTPLTSLRTNIEVLARERSMEPDERDRLLADLNTEIAELSNLVGELVDLATAPSAAEEEVQDVRLDEVMGEVVERARRRTGQRIEVTTEPIVVRARPGQLERAVSNVVDNACKWNPKTQVIEVVLSEGRLEVRDRGPGIAADDLPYVFDRFFRAPAARALPGSGLGLAITKQVIEDAGGRVFAQPRDGGGVVVGFELEATKALDEIEIPEEKEAI
jgi:two-component system, OmpR family, sensor histidine kinase MprB